MGGGGVRMVVGRSAQKQGVARVDREARWSMKAVSCVFFVGLEMTILPTLFSLDVLRKERMETNR